MAEKTDNLFDHRLQNKELENALKTSISQLFPIENSGKKIVLNNISIEDNLNDYDFPAQKDAKIKRKSWQMPIYADFEILNDKGKVLSKQTKLKIGNLPKITNRFTTIIEGNEYQTVNQLRRKSGIYSRIKRNGELEAEFNLAKGKNFKMQLDPISQLFVISYANRKYRLWTLLTNLGMTDTEIEKVWGNKLLDINKKGALNTEASEMNSIYEIVYGKEPKNYEDMKKGLQNYFNNLTEIDSAVTKMTLGAEFGRANSEALLATSKKLLDINRGEQQPDDRDSLLYKRIYSVEDLMNSYFEKQSPIIQNKIKRSLGLKDRVREIVSPATFGEPIKRFFTVGDLSSTPAQTNPVEIVNVWRKTTPMGTGGIKSHHAITMETRDVQPTHLGFLDSLNTPESGKVGVTVGLTSEVRKRGNDIVTPVVDKNNKLHWLDPIEFYNSKIGFPDQYDLTNGKPKPNSTEIKSIHKGQSVILKPGEIDYYLRSPRTMFSFPSNLVPFLPNTQANRAGTGARMIGQAMGLDDREPPLVRTYRDSKSTYEDLLGGYLNPKLEEGETGTVEKVEGDYIDIKLSNGKSRRLGIYNNFPLNQDGFLNSTVLVKPGDKVDSTTALTESNYSKGNTLSIGKNLTVAYMPYKGYNFEDGAVITEDAAKKLSHTMLHKENIFFNPKMSKFDKEKFMAWYPDIITPDNSKKLDSRGIIKVGQTIDPGEVLAAFLVEKELDEQEAALKKLNKFIFNMYSKNVTTWDEEEPGIVTDVSISGRNIDIYVKSTHPFKEGDKLSGRYGNKYVVTKIIPTSDAPYRPNNEPIDIMLSPHSVPSRMNIGQILETAAGKIAEKTGKPYIVNNFEKPNEDMANKVYKEMQDLGIEPNEILTDGKTGQKIKNPIFVGKQYIMKLRHIVNKKQGVHNYGVYDVDEQPAGKGAQKVGIMDTYAYLAHGAKSNLYEIANIKGRRNEEYWRDLQFGLPPAKPSKNFIFDKMTTYLKGAGINVNKKGNQLQILPLTDDDITTMSNGEIKDPGAMLVGKNLTSRKDGLFDGDVTGGVRGTQWGHINLVDRIPNPMFEDAIMKALDLTENAYESVLSGKQQLNGKTGHDAIISALKEINVKKRVKELKEQLKTAPPTNVNKLNTKIRYMEALQDLEMDPIKAYTLSKIPIIPPVFRPAYPLPSGDLVVSDINKHYRDVGLINSQLKNAINDLPDKEKLEGMSTLYNSVKAMQGFIDPITYSKEKYKGFIQELGKMKTGLIHGKTWSHRQDLSGRSTITVEPNLGLNEVGIPTEFAYTAYKPFILRSLKESGIKATQALKHYEDKSSTALLALENVLKDRPVILNRAPSLHKHSVQAFRPVLTSGKSIRLNPLVVKGFNADFDGDSVDLDTPLLLKINNEIVYKTGKQLEDLLAPEDGNYICVVKNMETYGYSGWNPIKTISFHEVLNKKKFKITLNNGYSFIVSEDHSLMSNKQKVKPLDLHINQELDNIIIKKDNTALDDKEYHLGFLDGHFLGDGCADSRRVTLACKPSVERTFIKNLWESLYSVHVYESTEHGYLQISNITLAKKYLLTFGRYSRGKFISDETFNKSDSYLKGMLAGYILADGSVEFTKSGSILVRTWSKSKLLRDHFSFIATLLGITHSIRQRKDNYLISFGKDSIKKLSTFPIPGKKGKLLKLAMDNYEDRVNRINHNTKGFRIKTIEEIEYLDRMIDLEVEKEHVFSIASGVILHNTMSVMVPIGKEAIEEARQMVPSQILFKHGDNSLMPAISQDYLYGLYELSKIVPGKVKRRFSTIMEAKNSDLPWTELFSLNGKDMTIGQYMINAELPQELKDYTREMNKKTVNNLLTEIGKKHPTFVEDVFNSWKDLGASYSYINGNTISITDFAIDHTYRNNILKRDMPGLEGKSLAERATLMNDITKRVQVEQDKELYQKNNIYKMLTAGSFSKPDSVRQILSMPGVLTDIENKPLPIPVTTSYGEGLDTSSYFNTMYSARKGTVDRSVNTQQTGALTKDVLNVARKFLVVETDCGTKEGIEFDINDKNLMDRTLLFTVPKVGKRNDIINTDVIMKAKSLNIDKLWARSPLTCEAVEGVCQLCYGLLPNGQLPPLGTNVGILDSEAITERATQLTMQCESKYGLLRYQLDNKTGSCTHEDLWNMIDSEIILLNNIENKEVSGNLKLWSKNGWVKVNKLQRHLPEVPMIFIKLKDGNALITQEDHPLALYKKYNECECPTPHVKFISQNLVKCDTCKREWEVTENFDNYKKDLLYNVNLNEDGFMVDYSEIKNFYGTKTDPKYSGYFFGFYAGDGCLIKHNNKYLGITISQPKKTNLITRNSFLKSAELNKLSINNNHPKRVDIRGKEVAEYVETIVRSYAQEKQLEGEYYRYSKRWLAEFLAGLIDTDGTIMTKHKGSGSKTSRIKIYSTSWALMQQVYIICQILEIKCTLNAEKFRQNNTNIKHIHQQYSATITIPEKQKGILNASIKVKTKYKKYTTFNCYFPEKYISEIISYKTVHYDDYTYDFPVEEKTYFINGILYHNTFHTGGSALGGGGIQAGIPRIEQLIKVPERLSGKATLSELNGVIKSITKNQTGGYNVLVDNKLHIVPAGRRPIIEMGQTVEPGQPLSDGVIKPQELGALKSHLDAQKYMVNELSNVYGGDFYKKTFETSVKAISDNAEVTKAPDDSGFLRGDSTTISYLNYLNRLRQKEGLDKIEYKPYFKSVQTSNTDTEDWMTKVTTNRVKAALTTGAAKAQYANLKGKDPIPAYIYGVEFGKDTNYEKGEFY